MRGLTHPHGHHQELLDAQTDAEAPELLLRRRRRGARRGAALEQRRHEGEGRPGLGFHHHWTGSSRGGARRGGLRPPQPRHRHAKNPGAAPRPSGFTMMKDLEGLDSTLKQRFGSMAVVHSSSPPWPRATTTRETLAPEPSGSRRSSSPRHPEPGAAPATLKRRRLGIHGRHHPSSAGGPRAGPFGAPATRRARLPRPSPPRATAGREVLHRDITLHGAELSLRFLT